MCGWSARDRLAPLAEIYMREGFVDEEIVREEIAPCFVEKDGARTDIVVLGCTHYPFLANRMRKTAPWPVDWIDPAEAIARRAMSLLRARRRTAAGGRARHCRLHLRQGGFRHQPADAGLWTGRELTAANVCHSSRFEDDAALIRIGQDQP